MDVYLCTYVRVCIQNDGGVYDGLSGAITGYKEILAAMGSIKPHWTGQAPLGQALDPCMMLNKSNIK